MTLLTYPFKRAACLILGHKFRHAKVYSPRSKSMEPGYCCRRCGKTQSLLWRWQSVSEGE